MPAIGIAIEEITSGTFGRVMQVGLMEHFNTDAFAEGDVLYVSADIAGAMTTTPPTYPNIRQEIGTVLVKGVGEGAMQIVARTMLYEPIIDHAGLLNLEEGDPHTQYVLESGYTAKGVILVGTAAGTFVALSVDANGTVLTADSGEASGVKWAASSSGVTELASLSDVTITPATLDIILYDGSTWVNTTLNDPGGITELRSLSDVVIATPATVDTLIFDGSTWINTQFSATGSGFTKLASMSDVTIISPATLDILMHDGSTWINTDCTYTHSLAGLDDVTVSAPATLDTMVYNGSIWINQSALFNEIANVRMTMVGSNMIQLTGIGGTNGLFYINGEIANLSTTIRTLDNLSTMILDDGTDSTSPTVAATTLFVYASNSLVTSMPNQLRTSIYSPNANKYLGTTGDAKNWRLAGWVYLVTASGTPFYYDENSALFAISKWNPKQKYGFISNTTSHSYTTASWRTWLNNIALTRIEFIQHEDFLNLHTMMQVYYYGTGSSGANANSVGYDSTSVPDDTTTIYFRNGTNDDNRFRTGSSGIQLMTPGYHYVNVLQLGSANSLLYNACYLTINIWG
ncbi:hypothetical protein M0R19_06340 [Candidatus Pacearchaeota archaeon]|nr:hypothetical protein [Candidatus Pacearchaeota archaeon]